MTTTARRCQNTVVVADDNRHLITVTDRNAEGFLQKRTVSVTDRANRVQVDVERSESGMVWITTTDADGQFTMIGLTSDEWAPIAALLGTDPFTTES